MAFLEADAKRQLLKGSINNLVDRAQTVGRKLLDVILPPKCLNCAGRVDLAHNICPQCWKELHFLSDPMCRCCGYPFGADLGVNYITIGDSLCGSCQNMDRAFDRALSALRYDDDSRRMIIGFKHHDRLEYATYFAKLLKQAGSRVFADTDMIIPVPLHKRRLIKRRYNQSALLSRILAEDIGVAHEPELLIRTKNTPPQEGNLNKRSKNVHGAFKVIGTNREKVKNRTILLIDDVYTTGATAENCAKALKKAGAAKVYVLTILRVIKPRTPI